ncbi:MAG: molybdenum cofactor guanylyltransferase MobA [Rhizobiaceae bacterium]
MTIAGVILAGGQSRRMGGSEKSLLKLGGKAQIEWVADCLEPQVVQMAINANGDSSRFNFLDFPVLEDVVGGFVGPLSGVLTGMKWAEGLSGVTHIMTAAADTPFIPHDFVSQLNNLLAGESDIAMASSNGRIHPVFGLWPIHLANELEHFLVAEDKRKIIEFAKRYTMHEVVFDTKGEDPFFNINTPEDLAIAKTMAKEITR